MASDAVRIETIETIHVTPDPGVLRAIGLNHDFESAIADLVDNSIDANAKKVLIRFVLQGGHAVRLLVIDNGRGMDTDDIDGAMRLGRPKANATKALGHFGMGLKSASFSQASTLTVLSRRRVPHQVGRRIHRESKGTEFEVHVLDATAVGVELDRVQRSVGFGPYGTIVQWDDCRTFPAAQDRTVTDSFLEARVAGLRNRLGVIFHRLIERGDVEIGIDVWDADEHEGGLEFTVDPINPFGYTRSGVPDYPKKLVADFKGRSIELDCHLWPGNSDSHQYRLHGAPVESFQGFYLYRNDRLLMTGGWCGTTHERKQLRLARVSVNIEDHLDGFEISMEKSGVHLVPDLVHSIERATDGETSFQNYLDEAAAAFVASNRRVRHRAPILPPGKGIAPPVKRAITDGTPLLEGEPPVDIRWDKMSGDAFVVVDRANQTLWLNARYRDALLKGGRGGANDAPLLKALLFLVYEDLFRGQAMGVKDKENQTFWNDVVTAAAKAELDAWDGGR